MPVQRPHAIVEPTREQHESVHVNGLFVGQPQRSMLSGVIEFEHGGVDCLLPSRLQRVGLQPFKYSDERWARAAADDG